MSANLQQSPRQNRRFWKEHCFAAIVRNGILRVSRHLGRAIGKCRSGYHFRSRIEEKMRGLKSFGEGLAPRDEDRQSVEIQIHIAIVNHSTLLGQAEIGRVTRD